MKTIAIAALIAAPALAKKLAQTKDEGYAEPAYDDYEAASYKDSYKSYGGYSYETYSDGASVSINSHSDNSHDDNSVEIHSGSNYSVNDRDQYHNEEDNNQSPYVDYAADTTT